MCIIKFHEFHEALREVINSFLTRFCCVSVLVNKMSCTDAKVI